MDITRYKSADEEAIFSAIGRDPDWVEFTKDETRDAYIHALDESVTYICKENNEFCGYVRAILDEGLALYVSELYVVMKWRNRKIGQSLLERVRHDFPSLTVYALSDEDLYYEKKGYKKIGSVFEINQMTKGITHD